MMQVQQLNLHHSEVKNYLQNLGVDGGGVEILSAKAHTYTIAILALHVGAANILKQDALSVGADLAVPRGTVVALEKEVDCLLIATKRELQKLAKKELAQPFGLKKVAHSLQKIINASVEGGVEIMGVLNANDDSFYAQSRFVACDAIAKIYQMIDEGATIIDIGGVSSRPNAPVVSVEEELLRVKDIVDTIANEKLYEKVRFSIDSYAPKVVQYALDGGFEIVNDITGLSDDNVCRLCGEYGATAVIMHMQGTPQTMQNNPHYEDVLEEVYHFFQERIAKAESFGISDIVLDVGIGFGKNLQDNISLIKNLCYFQTLNKPLLVGASRKSMIDKIFPSDVSQRLSGTLALHLEAVRNGANIVRVHDVYEHKQALMVQEALNSPLSTLEL
jgi:dihydropteroate synthase